MVNNRARKFKDFDHFDAQQNGHYYLLPFRFLRLTEKKEVLVNEVGDHLVVPSGTVSRIVRKDLIKSEDPDLYGDLIANFFISETQIPALIDIYATRYRTKKAFLDGFTSLHIFVMTLRCEHTCHYCQVSRVTQDRQRFDMHRRHIDKGIEWMLRSPNPFLTMEFQGGETLLAFDEIRYAIEKVSRIAPSFKKVTFVLCTNLALINEEILSFCREHSVLISSSLDGPDFIHNANRRRPGNNSYELTIRGIEKARKALGHDRVSALMTTTTLSLDHPVAIVEEYYKQGFRNIFLRPISPYGFALKNSQKNKYDSHRFLDFYKKAFDRILEYNFSGERFTEDYATILLRKILTPFPVDYVDLNSPVGAINNVIVFNYDGAIYASDESRMLAETKDFEFKLGHFDTHEYETVFYGDRARQIVEAGVNESLPGCSDCAFQPYCGADPIHNHATQGDKIGYRPASTFCHKNMELIRYLIDLMDSDQRVLKIFESWIKLEP